MAKHLQEPLSSRTVKGMRVIKFQCHRRCCSHQRFAVFLENASQAVTYLWLISRFFLKS